MKSKKRSWTEAEWIEYGNRVKQLKIDITSILVDGSKVMTLKQIGPLRTAERKLREAVSKLENAVAVVGSVREEFIVRVFYGEKFPDNFAELTSEQMRQYFMNRAYQPAKDAAK